MLQRYEFFLNYNYVLVNFFIFFLYENQRITFNKQKYFQIG